MASQIKAIAATGVSVVVSGGKVGDMALHFLNKHNLMAVRLNSKFDLRRLARTVRATVLPRMVSVTIWLRAIPHWKYETCLLSF